jgi:hypothetical protein
MRSGPGSFTPQLEETGTALADREGGWIAPPLKPIGQHHCLVGYIGWCLAEAVPLQEHRGPAPLHPC